jgi:hypothetical protein
LSPVDYGGETMWRAFFLAIGFFLMILGAQCLAVERGVLRVHDDPPAPISPFDIDSGVGAAKEVVPPPWAPWSLLSSGAVMCLYSFTIPRRVAGN